MYSFTSKIWKENLCLLLLVILINEETANSAKVFEYTQNQNGTVMCALDQPSIVITLDQLPPLPSGSCSPVVIRCAWQCTLDPNCTNFNYKEDKGRCELFHYTPHNCSTSSVCNHLQVNGMKSCHIEVQLTTTTCMQTVDQNGCSLPFQYLYEEYNQCINVTGINILQCATLNGTLTNCSYPIGFVAKQDVVNVTLGTSDVPLPCINNWIIMMNRFDGSVSFNRSWVDYKMGFGNIRTSEFWIGNENFHLYTNKGGTSYRLRIELQGYTSGKWYFAEYDTFSVDSEASKYSIHLSGYVGNGGDSLSNTYVTSVWYHNGMNFSTFDADHDMWSGSCASKYISGWWFNNCWMSCLTCIYGTVNFSWYSLTDYQNESSGKLRAARMMIRSN